MRMLFGFEASILYGVSPCLFGLYKYLLFFGLERMSSVISRLRLRNEMCKTLSPFLSVGETLLPLLSNSFTMPALFFFVAKRIGVSPS